MKHKYDTIFLKKFSHDCAYEWRIIYSFIPLRRFVTLYQCGVGVEVMKAEVFF